MAQKSLSFSLMLFTYNMFTPFLEAIASLEMVMSVTQSESLSDSLSESLSVTLFKFESSKLWKISVQSSIV